VTGIDCIAPATMRGAQLPFVK